MSHGHSSFSRGVEAFQPPNGRKGLEGLRSCKGTWHARRIHMTKQSQVTFHGHHFKAILGFIMHGFAPRSVCDGVTSPSYMAWFSILYHCSVLYFAPLVQNFFICLPANYIELCYKMSPPPHAANTFLMIGWRGCTTRVSIDAHLSQSPLTTLSSTHSSCHIWCVPLAKIIILKLSLKRA